jgi:hypothetical protein
MRKLINNLLLTLALFIVLVSMNIVSSGYSQSLPAADSSFSTPLTAANEDSFYISKPHAQQFVDRGFSYVIGNVEWDLNQPWLWDIFKQLKGVLADILAGVRDEYNSRNIDQGNRNYRLLYRSNTSDVIDALGNKIFFQSQQFPVQNLTDLNPLGFIIFECASP